MQFGRLLYADVQERRQRTRRELKEQDWCALGITRIVSSPRPMTGSIGDSALHRYDDEAQIHGARRG